ncbi:MAG: DUF6941 family protein [Candidatus Saccharimonadales bacterium]
MIKAEYLLFINRIEIDANKRVNLSGVSERAYTPNVPVKVTELKLIVRLVTSDNKPILKKPINIKVGFNLKGQETSKIEVPQIVNIEKDTGWVPVFDISSVIFPDYGNYQVSFSVNGKELISRVFSIKSQRELSET